jgi:iron complex outermembrane receptor protein
MVLRADYTHKTSMFFDAANSESIAGSYTSLNARTALQWRTGWEVAVFGKNLTNKHNILGGQNTGAFGFAEVQWGAPREFGVSGRKTF